MKLEQSFEVQAPLQRVWEALIDVERVAPCLPGAAVTGRNPDGSYNGEFKVKIGPTSASYSGKLQMENVDEAEHSATMQAAGTDKRGQGGAKATIISSVAEAGAGATTVNVNTDYHITGRLARFGRGGMIEEISNRLLGEFAKSLQGMLADSGAAPAAAADAQAGPSAEVLAAQSAETEIAAGPSEPAEATSVDTPAPIGNGAAPEPATNEEPVAPTPSPEPTGTAVPPSQPTVSASTSTSAPAPAPAPAGGASASYSAPETEPIQGLSLMGTVLLNQVKRNPAPFAGALVAFAVVLRLRRRRR
jgi:carbon monoxide dehydrogenase subunit G